jgi:mannose-6-phosphate isomerase-like protein (cupin superfamily)
MVNLYNGFTNEIAGETFRCRSYTEDSFSFDWSVQPNGYVPFEHIHLNQDEIFYIETGEIKIVIDGKEHICGPGQTIKVPKGKSHIAYNNKPEMLVCRVEYKPGFDNYKFFQCFGGLTLDKDMNKRGQINIPKMLYFTRKMNAKCITRPTSVPAPLFKLALNVFYVAGSVLGWNRLYRKYTGEG